MKLLIVEDEWDLSNSIVAYLNSENYQCEQAFTYKEAKMRVNVYDYDCILLDLLSKTVAVNGHPMVLMRMEYELLLFLVSNRKKVISKSTTVEHLSGDMADMLDNYDFIYTHVKNLKSKMAKFGETDRLQNIYGMGYKWKEE